MEYTTLAATGVKVSKLCLGSMELGSRTTEPETIQLVRCALDHGINFIDTANAYMDGGAESIIGKALEGVRDSVILATKVGHSRHPEILNSVGTSRLMIMREVEKSLKRLRTDYIDVYYVHEPDPFTPLEEIVSAMSDLVHSGKIRYWGVSNYAAWQLTEMEWIAKCSGGIRPILSETVYNLLCRSAEPELVPCLLKHKVGMVVFNPLAGGLLTGKYSFDEMPIDGRFRGENLKYRNRYWNKDSFRAIEMLKDVSNEEGLSLIDFSLKWVAQQPSVESVIIGTRTMPHLIENVRALDGPKLSEDALKRADEIWIKISGTRFQYNR